MGQPPEHIVSDAMKKPPEYKRKISVHVSQERSLIARYGAAWVERNCNIFGVEK